MTQVWMTNKLVSRGYCLNPYPFWRESRHWLGMGMNMGMYIFVPSSSSYSSKYYI